MFHNVEHSFSLVVVRWHNSHESVESIFVGKVLRSGRIANLRYREELQQILHLQSNRTGSWSRHSNQWSFGRCGVRALSLAWTHCSITSVWSRHRLLDEIYRVLERNWCIPASVTDLDAQLDVLQEVRIVIDFIDCLKDDLHTLNAIVLANLKRNENSTTRHAV